MKSDLILSGSSTENTFAKSLRLLHEFGLLENFYIPEFKNICGLLQDIYVHHFPTDMHVLSALDILNGLEIDKNADPFLKRPLSFNT